MGRSNPPHILFISNTTQSLWNFRRDVIQDLKKAGMRVSCIAADEQYADSLKSLGVEFFQIPLSRSGMNPLHELRSIFRIRSVLNSQKPDCVFSYTIKPNTYVPWISRILGIPCVAVVTGLGYAFLQKNFKACIARIALKLSLRTAKGIWFLNQDDLKLVCGHSNLMLRKSSVLPGEGINTDYFDSQKFPAADEDFSFLLIARLIKDKGVFEFASAAKLVSARYPQTKFCILGALDPGNPASLSAEEWGSLCKDAPIEYLGTASDVRPFIARAKVCVLPSYREGIPFSLLEGGAMSKPLIATDVPGCRDVVKDNETGFIVPVRNAQALADAMVRMIEMSPVDFREMSDKVRQDIDTRYGIQTVLAHYHAALKVF